MEEAFSMNAAQHADYTEDAFRAVSCKNIVALRILLEDYSLDPNVRWAQRPGQTLLGTAARIGFTAGVKALLETGARVGDLIDDQVTALHLAVQSASEDCVKELLLAKADVNACTPLGSCITPLHFALSARMARLLISHGANIYAEMSKDALNWSPAFSALFNCAYGAFREIMREDMIKQRRLMEVRDYHGIGLGHAAATRENVVPLAVLRGYGLNPLSKSITGMTVFDMCISPAHRAILVEDCDVLFRRMESTEIR